MKSDSLEAWKRYVGGAVMTAICRLREQNIQTYVEAAELKLNTWFATTTTAIALLGEVSSMNRTIRYTMENYSAQEYALADIEIV